MHHYYLYQHTRLDTNEVFYIGIGKKQEKRIKGVKTEFERAYVRAKRSAFWKSIANKTEVKVEILLESNDLAYIKAKEIELIKKYGRRAYDPEGTLVNFDEGGGLNTCPKNRGVSINQLTLDGVLLKTWKELVDIQKELGFLTTNIVKCCRKKQLTAYGYKWQYSNDHSYDSFRASAARKKTSNRGVGVRIQHKHTGEVSIFSTTEECARYLGMHRTSIHAYLHKKRTHKLYMIEYLSWNHPTEAQERGFSLKRIT